jgi:hypothetical protein
VKRFNDVIDMNSEVISYAIILGPLPSLKALSCVASADGKHK